MGKVQAVLGFDIDGVLADSDAILVNMIKQFAKIKGVDENQIDWRKWYIYEKLGVEPEAEDEFWSTIGLGYYGEVRPVSGMVDLLHKAKTDGYKVVIITARDTEKYDTRAITSEWLRSHGFEYDTLVFDQDKLRACREYQVGFYVDDNPKNCKLVSEAGIEVCLFETLATKHFSDEEYRKVRSADDVGYRIIGSLNCGDRGLSCAI